VVTDKGSRTSRTLPRWMAYVVGGDVCDRVVMLFVSCLGHACHQLAADALCLFDGGGVYVRVQYRMTSGCCDIVRWSHIIIKFLRYRFVTTHLYNMHGYV